jgi:2-C-methyl-D-erythritol 4-phosphate cytidylyltransferase
LRSNTLARRTPRVGIVVAAGGQGKRVGGKLPKQFHVIGGETILARTLRVFAGMREVDAIVVVVPSSHVRRAAKIIAREGIRKIDAVVAGGAVRQSSVRAGLEAFSSAPDIVLVHDAVRPFVHRSVVKEVIRKAGEYGGAVVGVRVTDTIKEGSRSGYYTRTLARESLWAVQTPQGFRYPLLMRAHREAEKSGFVGTDEASLVERLGRRVRIVVGDPGNIKITTRQDLRMAKMRVE